MRYEMHIHIGRKRAGIKECMSIRALPTGRVSYVAEALLEDVTFAVQPAGLRKFRDTGQKNVHAYVRGHDSDDWNGAWPWREARYNPMKNDTFVDAELGFPVQRADRVWFDGNLLFYINF